jgi:Predicted Zn peptidase
LRIEEGGLDTAEGRIVVPSKSGGTIRVKAGLNIGRKRFTIAHEIGHFVLHSREGLEKNDTTASFTVWNDANEEAEANFFAAELLMPEFLFKPRCRGPVPSFALLDTLAHDFATSMVATAFQYVTYTNEQVALVVSHGNQIKWFHRSKESWPWIRSGNVHSHSAAGVRLAGKAGDTAKMVRTPAYAWLPDFEGDHEHDIMEDSRYLDWYDRTITLLWLKEDLTD